MTMIAQVIGRVRARPDRIYTASSFTTLSSHKAVRQAEKVIGLLGIENPFFRSTEGPQGRKTLIDGKPCLNFAWCDYLGLSQHPDLVAASKAAIDQYGTCVSASRVVAGDTPLHRELEQEIADTIGVDAAVVFVSGHAANVSTIGTLMSEGDLIVHDEFVHNSAVVGMRLSGAKAMTFPHNRLDKLEAILRAERANYRNVLVVIEGLYSTEGDLSDLARVIEIKDRYGAWLMVDDAHGCGVLGRTGRGLAEHWGVDARKVDIWMGTLSKAYASCGGYIAGSNDLIKILKYSAPGFVFSVGLPPSITAAALAALRVVRREPGAGAAPAGERRLLPEGGARTRARYRPRDRDRHAAHHGRRRHAGSQARHADVRSGHQHLAHHLSRRAAECGSAAVLPHREYDAGGYPQRARHRQGGDCPLLRSGSVRGSTYPAIAPADG
jgi:8-amino-7-oxononanoate synthase